MAVESRSVAGAHPAVTGQTSRRRLAKYKRRKDTARTRRQFSLRAFRFHRLCHRLHGAPDLWRST